MADLRNKVFKIPVKVEFTDIEDISDSSHFSTSPTDLDLDIEYLIFRIKDIRQVEIIVLKALGLKPKEITETMGYKSIDAFYQLNFRLKRDFEKLMRDEAQEIH